VTATGLADVGARDPQPLVLGRRRQHVLQQLAVLRLQFTPLPKRDSSLANPLGERVAHPLELFETGYARLVVARGNAGIEREPGKRLGAKPGELVLETTDLAAQLSAREALVASHPKRCKRFSIE